MTLNGHFALKSVSGSATNELAFLAFGQNCSKFEELPIYCQRQNCSQGILVSGKVRLCGYSREFSGEGTSNESGVVVNGDLRFFRSLYLPNLYIHRHNYYNCGMKPLSSTSLTPKRMTLVLE